VLACVVGNIGDGEHAAAGQAVFFSCASFDARDTGHDEVGALGEFTGG